MASGTLIDPGSVHAEPVSRRATCTVEGCTERGLYPDGLGGKICGPHHRAGRVVVAARDAAGRRRA